eukprot:3703446-Pyramimonas_sp.AAC.1
MPSFKAAGCRREARRMFQWMSRFRSATVAFHKGRCITGEPYWANIEHARSKLHSWLQAALRPFGWSAREALAQ